ncbi:ion transporter [Methanobrevibacter sp.]
MNFFGKEVNNQFAVWIFMHIIIIIDIVLISAALILNLPAQIERDIQFFDFCICIILLIEWCIRFYISRPKKIFLKQKGNWIDLIASIPFDMILPIVIPQAGILRFLRLLKLMRMMALFNRFFEGFERFIKITNLDKILGGLIFTVFIFTTLLYIYGSSYSLFDDFYFVIVTLTTVGYGDVIPKTFNEKLITVLLVFVGIFIFSTITAAISSFLTEKLLSDDNEEIEDKFEMIQDELKELKKDLERSHEENKDLKEEITELKKIMLKND